MKKYLSLIISATMALSMIAPSVTSAESSTLKLNSMVVLGDSIASGYGLGESEHTYSEICADYFGAELSNFAVAGLDSYELLDMIQNITDEQKTAIENTDVIIISTGGNDIMNYIIKQLLDFSASHNLLASGYTSADIPEEPTSKDMKMIDPNAFKAYANGDINNIQILNSLIKSISRNLRLTTNNNKGIIPNEIMVNIDKIVKEIKAVNPDTQVIVQTVYQPLQLSKSYVSKNYSTSHAIMINTFRDALEDIMNAFRTELQKIQDIEIIDVYDTFTANGDVTTTSNNPGHAYYFTDIQESYFTIGGENSLNVHPNQKGHLAISSLLIDKIKINDGATGEAIKPAEAERPVDTTTGETVPTVFNQVFYSIEDIRDYPPLAMEQIVEAIPDKVSPGDVNGDGKIDAIDATAILTEYASLSTGDGTTLTQEESNKADTNYDGHVDANDATQVQMYYAYLSTEHEGETLNIFHYRNQIQAEENAN
ncbi:MAG: hypothetical protein K2G36_10130 [Ruminococcus sp.]|nr:hypothetical protein [Ruminococcus sp.]